MTLLNTNKKLEKPVRLNVAGDWIEENWLIRGLTLAPANHSGHEVCTWRGACGDACSLWFSGRTVTQSVRAAAIRRARLFFEDRPLFLRMLAHEIEGAAIEADRLGARLAVRLNTASDIVWERIAPEILETIRRVGAVAYDYTKAAHRHRPTTPDHYYLSHSIHERTTSADIHAAIDAGRNVVLVIDSEYVANGRRPGFGAIPSEVLIAGRLLPTVDGDAVGDLRLPHVDGVGSCVVLRGKGGRRRVAEAVAGGFIHPAGWLHDHGRALAMRIVPGTLAVDLPGDRATVAA